MKGRVFEIREFTLHDGPGVRTTVFFKGCPLRCAWCHNPEGQSPEIETMTRANGERVACGVDWDADALAAELLKNADILAQSGGGVTFSGGEPLAQTDFLLALVPLLKAASLHLAIETSGYAPLETYQAVIGRMDFVYQDLKHHDPDAFREWCGGDLGVVLRNLDWLKTSGVPFCIRIPDVPGVNDTPRDRAAFAKRVGDSPVEHLPFNPVAGAKYPWLGRPFKLSGQVN
ncbi:MAG: radical SAM protein [Kiritimatiellia bacterium]|jgi:pyruvate formate lyase activating enzyme